MGEFSIIFVSSGKLFCFDKYIKYNLTKLKRNLYFEPYYFSQFDNPICLFHCFNSSQSMCKGFSVSEYL